MATCSPINSSPSIFGRKTPSPFSLYKEPSPSQEVYNPFSITSPRVDQSSPPPGLSPAMTEVWYQVCCKSVGRLYGFPESVEKEDPRIHYVVQEVKHFTLGPNQAFSYQELLMRKQKGLSYKYIGVLGF